MPFFSIIIPTYNRGELISKTIHSVLAQTFTDFEVIVVDDGSNDDTKWVVEAISDSRVKYIYQSNGERGKARNNGTKHATGQYVFFLDSDDLLYPQHLETAYNHILKLNLPTFFHVRYEHLIGDQPKAVRQLPDKNINRLIVRQNYFAAQFFLKREVALDFPFSENRQLKIGEDWEVVLKIAVRYPLYFTNEVHAAIVQHEQRSMELATFKEILVSRDLILANLRADDKIPAKVLRFVWAELTTLASLSAAIQNHKKQAFILLRKGAAKSIRILFKRRTLAIIKKIIFNGKA